MNELSGKDNQKLTFAPCGNIVWNGFEYIVLNVLDHFDEFYSDMLNYLKSFDIQEDIFEDLLHYQKAIIRHPSDKEKIVSLHYDVHTFLNRIYTNEACQLIKKEHRLKMVDSQAYTNWQDFGKYVVWYGHMGWHSYKDIILPI